jgi:hypothetical protein
MAQPRRPANSRYKDRAKFCLRALTDSGNECRLLVSFAIRGTNYRVSIPEGCTKVAGGCALRATTGTRSPTRRTPAGVPHLQL